MKLFKNKYRVVEDQYLGYEAQIKPWWSPFGWFEIGLNTSSTIERAERCFGRVVKEYEEE